MGRKNYLLEELSKEEKAYLKRILINERRRYIRDNYNYLNSTNLHIYDFINVEADSVLESVINKCEEEIKSAIEFEKLTSNGKLYYGIKALSLKEKMVLFALYKENKEVNQIALEMQLDRTTVWRIKDKALDKLMRCLIGGGQDV